MAEAVFICIILIGLYLCLHAYSKISLRDFISNISSIIIIGGMTYCIVTAITEGHLHPNRRIVIPPTLNPVRNEIVIGEINADDIDPQLQNALLQAIGLPPRKTTDEVLAQLTVVESPQEGVCGVCYDTLEEGELLGCPECKKPAHEPCLREWIESKQDICIYCRHKLVKA